MAISSKLQFGQKDVQDKWQLSKEYNVVDCHLHFMRHYNHFRPDTDARCEKVEVVVEAPGKVGMSITRCTTVVFSLTYLQRLQKALCKNS